MKKHKKKKPKPKAVVSKKINLPAKPSEAPIISASITKEALTPSQLLRPPPSHRRSPKEWTILAAKIFGAVVAVVAGAAAVVTAVGYVAERWNEAMPTMDLVGDVDSKSPFNIPIIIKDPSTILDVHNAKVSCEFSMIFDTPHGRPVLQGKDNKIYETPLITANNPFVFVSTVASTLVMKSHDTGESMPIERGLMVVTITYDKQAIFTFHREATAIFNLMPTSTGYRWVKGRKLPG